eukprot:3173314-Pyramimonas_sp.AAC.1
MLVTNVVNIQDSFSWRGMAMLSYRLDPRVHVLLRKQLVEGVVDPRVGHHRLTPHVHAVALE